MPTSRQQPVRRRSQFVAPRSRLAVEEAAGRSGAVGAVAAPGRNCELRTAYCELYRRATKPCGIEGDERKGGHETVWQGEVTFRYHVADRVALLAGFQRAQRRQSFEEEVVHNTNFSLGATYAF